MLIFHLPDRKCSFQFLNDYIIQEFPYLTGMGILNLIYKDMNIFLFISGTRNLIGDQVEEEKDEGKKLVVRMLCLAMAASMIGTMVPTSLYPVVAHAETAGQEASTAKAVLEDGIRDKWTQDNLMGFDSVCKVEDGWLHLRSSVDNGNNPGTKPAMFVNSKEFNFNEAGYFDFTLKPANGDGRFWCISRI